MLKSAYIKYRSFAIPSTKCMRTSCQAKVILIQDLKKSGQTAMVRDGMIDAPALAAADGIAGSEVAIETGNMTLMSNDIQKIPQAIRLARLTWRRVVENIVLSVVTKAGILALAFARHPLLWAAASADVAHALLSSPIACAS